MNEHDNFEFIKETIKFHQEYLEHIEQKCFEYFKSLILFFTVLNGTVIITIFSLKNNLYYESMVTFIHSFSAMFCIILFLIILNAFITFFKLKNKLDSERNILYYYNKFKFIITLEYILLIVLFIIEVLFFIYGLYKASRIFMNI